MKLGTACCLKRKLCASAVVAVALASLFAFLWYRLGAPDAIQPDEQFEIQFGRGSGFHGLDVLRITSDGTAWYEYQVSFDNWHRKRFKLDDDHLADLRRAINQLDAWNMREAYHGYVADGTQWCLLIRLEGKSKSVYFDNNFPRAIRKFSDFVDEAILAPLADPLEPEIVPPRHHRKHEKDLWESIR